MKDWIKYGFVMIFCVSITLSNGFIAFKLFRDGDYILGTTLIIMTCTYPFFVLNFIEKGEAK